MYSNVIIDTVFEARPSRVVQLVFSWGGYKISARFLKDVARQILLKLVHVSQSYSKYKRRMCFETLRKLISMSSDDFTHAQGNFSYFPLATIMVNKDEYKGATPNCTQFDSLDV